MRVAIRTVLTSVVLTATLLAPALLVPAVPAAAQGVDLTPPPCVTEIRNNPVTEFTNNVELRQELRRLTQISSGRITVSEFGRSHRNRALLSARVGTGPQVFLAIAEIHGNEKVGPDGMLRVLEWLGTSEEPQARLIRERVTLVAVPKMNPDGAELDRRGNDRSWADVVADLPQLAGAAPAWNYIQRVQQGDDYTRRPGFDLNRDFHPDLDYVPDPADLPGDTTRPGFFIHPESQALRDLYRSLADEFDGVATFLDIHHQGACVGRDDTRQLIDVAVDYPPLPDAEFLPGGKYAGYQNRQDLSRRLAISAFNGIEAGGFLGVRYGHPPERDIPGQARSAFALNGTGTVLFEIRGQTQNLGQLGRERFTRATVAGLRQMLVDRATGAVDRIDPRTYDSLPGSINLSPPATTAGAPDPRTEID